MSKVRSLVVMDIASEKLFKDAFTEYEDANNSKPDVFIIDSNVRNNLKLLERYLVKFSGTSIKENYYERIRGQLLSVLPKYDRIVFLDLIWDDGYFIDAQLAKELEKHKCILYFIDPMSELPQKFLYWDIFQRIYSFEYRDTIEYGPQHQLDVKFLPLGTRYYLYDQNNDERKEKTYDYDICFVGLGTSERLIYLEEVAAYANANNLRFFVAGHFWHTNNFLNELSGKSRFAKKYPFLSRYIVNKYVLPEELYNLYKRTKICLNINTPGHKTFNSRCLDIMYCESVVLTEAEDMFGYDCKLGEYVHMCTGPKDMVIKIQALLSNDDSINKDVYEIKSIVDEKYTFKSTIKSILND